MARIPLSSGVAILPEATYEFKVVSTEYKEAYGKVTINFETEDGKKHSERFTLLNDKGKINEQAQYAFTKFAQAILNDEDLEDVDPRELEDSHVIGNIKHTTSQDGTKTYAHLTDLQPVDEIKPNKGRVFPELVEEITSVPYDEPQQVEPAPTGEIDLLDLLK